MAILQVQRGIQSNPNSTTPFSGRGGADGDVMVSELHGRYYQTTYDARMFGIQGTAVTTTAAGAGTFTGLLVGNPVGSGVNMVLNKVTIAQFAALTASTNLGIMYGPSTLPITASLVPVPRNQGSGAVSKMVATAGQTITAPTSFIILGGGGSGAMTVPGFIPGLNADLEGSLIIAPGNFVASFTGLVTTSALLFGFQWEEVPI